MLPTVPNQVIPSIIDSAKSATPLSATNPFRNLWTNFLNSSSNVSTNLLSNTTVEYLIYDNAIASLLILCVVFNGIASIVDFSKTMKKYREEQDKEEQEATKKAEEEEKKSGTVQAETEDEKKKREEEEQRKEEEKKINCTTSYVNCKKFLLIAYLINGCLSIVVSLWFIIVLTKRYGNDLESYLYYKVYYSVSLLLVLCQAVILFLLDRKTCYSFQNYIHSTVIFSIGLVISLVMIYFYLHDYIKKNNINII